MKKHEKISNINSLVSFSIGQIKFTRDIFPKTETTLDNAIADLIKARDLLIELEIEEIYGNKKRVNY